MRIDVHSHESGTGDARGAEGGEVPVPISGGERDVLLEFSVADTGIGISLKEQDRIFTPFGQADA